MSNKPQLWKNLWTLPFESLNSEDKERFRKYHSEKVVETVNEAQAVQAKQRTYLQKRWTLKTNSGRRIIIHDVLDEIAFRINKFKEVGILLCSMTPPMLRCHGQACGFSCRCQSTISNAIAGALETVARLTSRYSIFENVYLPPAGQELTTAQSKLCEALVLLYSDCLRYLGDIGKYYECSTGERVVRSIFKASDFTSKSLEIIANNEAEVENPVIILRNLLKQLAVVQEDQKVRQSLWEEYRRRQEAANMNGLEPSPLTAEECIQMLLTLTLDSLATIIIDGLDELDGQRRGDLPQALHNLINESSSIVKIMIASCEDTGIAQGLEGALSISVSASENSADIGKYVQHNVSLAITSKRLLERSRRPSNITSLNPYSKVMMLDLFRCL